MAEPRFTRSEAALWHRTSGRTLLSPPADGPVLELAGVAAMVWEVLGEPLSVTDVAADLAAVFDRPAGVIEPVIERLLADLVAAGAARRVP